MSEPERGPVEAATAADVERLGVLHGVQPALAASAVTLARKLDTDPNAADARELRMTLKDLWHLRHFGVGDQVEDEKPPVPVDPVDEVGAARARRLAGEAGS